MFGKLFLKQNCKFCEACSRERGGGCQKSVCIIRKLAKYIAYRILEIKAIDIQKDMLMMKRHTKDSLQTSQEDV